MKPERSAAMVIAAAATFPLVPAPLRASSGQTTAIDGHCQYTDRVADQRNETLLILCDAARIGRDGTDATIEFSRRSWGSMAQFAGSMSGDKMAVSRVTLRNGRSVPATGSCELFRRGDGQLSVIACLAKAASRWIAANFVPSNL